jgi:hypothetical protein
MDVSQRDDLTSSRNSGGVALVLTACVLGALWAFLVFSDNFVFGSVAGNWSYEYLKRVNPLPAWLPIAVAVLLALAVFLGSRFIHLRERTTLLCCLAATLAVQVLIRNVSGIPLGSLVQDAEANGFYSAAIQYSPAEILSSFETLAPTLPQHARTNMPGKILLFQLLRGITASPEVMGAILLGLSAAGALLMYAVCNRLFHDRQAAFCAFVLYALVPSRLFFLPLLNTITPVLALLLLYMLLIHLDSRSRAALWMLGAGLYLMVLFEPSPLVTGILFAGILLHALLQGSFTPKEAPALLLNTLFGFLGAYALFFLLFGFDLFGTLQLVVADAVKFNLKAQRGYWLWIAENAKEFSYSVGTPILIIVLYRAIQLLTDREERRAGLASWPIEVMFVFSLLATFGAVLLLGINRGEISRLWIYLAVLFQIPAAFFIARLPRSNALLFVVACTLAFQSLIALQHVGFV